MLKSINWHDQITFFGSSFRCSFLIIFGVILCACALTWFRSDPAVKSSRISNKKRASKKIIMDTVNTLSSIVVFSVFACICYFFYYKHHPSLVYNHISQHGMLYFLFSIQLLFLLHDAYFYWTHRLMHHRLLFRHVHKTHHRSQHPTAVSGFAFSPFEAAIQAMFVMVVPAILPVQFVVFVVFNWMLVIRVIYGHNGHEKSTLTREKIGLYKILSTPTHHEMHHTRSNSNYGLWFVFWDKLMGTENKSYYAELKKNILKKQDSE